MKKSFKSIIEKILPHSIYLFIKIKKNRWTQYKKLKRSYTYDLKRYLSYSDTLATDTDKKLIGKIIRMYHVVEKGLTMPETRLGFGKDLMLKLITDCIEFNAKYDRGDLQFQQAIGVIWEYEEFHIKRNFPLDDQLKQSIEKLRSTINNVQSCVQKETTKNSFFSQINEPFPLFASSRSSVRNYTGEEIPLNRIKAALEIGKTTPSACNRQCWRTYVFTDKKQIEKILQVQGGNRGFGHLTNKLIVITAEVGVFTYVGERNEAYIDGGMYAMNLLYALHFEKIAACILNCSNTIEKDKELRSLCNILESEVFIAMISCGIPPYEFKIASSKRYDTETTNIFC